MSRRFKVKCVSDGTVNGVFPVRIPPQGDTGLTVERERLDKRAPGTETTSVRGRFRPTLRRQEGSSMPLYLDTFDLNLLVPLSALLREQSVTKAAERVSITQPSISA